MTDPLSILETLNVNPWFLIGALNKLVAYQKADGTADSGTTYAAYLSAQIYDAINAPDPYKAISPTLHAASSSQVEAMRAALIWLGDLHASSSSDATANPEEHSLVFRVTLHASSHSSLN
jgi:hypothetical protein